MKHFKQIYFRSKFSSDDGSNWFQIYCILTMSIASFNVGAQFAWVSPSIPILISEEYPLEITLEEASYLTVLPPLSAMLSSLLFAVLTDKIGRKKSLLLIAIPHVISWALIIFANSIYDFYISRFINGFADSIMFTVVPTYMSEISTPSVRGSWGNVLTLGIYVGQFFINAIGGYLDITRTAWCFFGVPLIFLIFAIQIPESPYFLIMKNRHDDARVALQVLRRRRNVDEELQQLSVDVKRQTEESGRWKDLFTNSTHRKALVAGVFMRGAQQYSGIAAFSTYTVYLFMQAGSSLSSHIAAMGYTSLITILNIISSLVLDRIGRRLSMVISCAICSVALLIEAVYFYLKEYTDTDLSVISWTPILAMLIYVLSYSIGLGIVPTLMIGELFSASIKAKGVCMLNITFSLYVLSSTKLFQSLGSLWGLTAPFGLFFVCCLVSTFISYYVIPETKGKTLEEIQQSMKKGSSKK